MQPRLGKSYVACKPISDTFVTKKQIMLISLTSAQLSKDRQDSTFIFQNKQQESYNRGKIYHNTYTPYCLLCRVQIASTHSIQIEMNNQRVNDVKIPFWCPFLGPYLVENKNQQVIGELKPHCYIFKPCLWSFFYPGCIELDINETDMKQTYKARRQNFTCFGCTKWDIFDQLGNVQAEIRQTGWLFPNYQISLSEASEIKKNLVLSSLWFLP